MRITYMLLIFLFLFSFLHCGKRKESDLETLLVNAPPGLRMRTAPDINSSMVMTIPHKSEVIVIETVEPILKISGVKGKWTKVEYQNSEGWVFGGFLVPKNSDAYAHDTPILKLERSSCGCPGGCGHIEIKIEFIGKDKAKITETIDADEPMIRIFNADYSIHQKNFIIKNLSTQQDYDERYFEKISDFTLEYKEELNGYLPKESSYFSHTIHAFTSEDYVLKKDKCAFVEKKLDECGTSSWVGYFCKK